MEMKTDEEKRWLVVGIVMVKVIAPVLRDVVEQGIKLHYSHLDAMLCPCKLNVLTFADYNSNPSLKNLKFENVNNNRQTHGKDKNKYNFSVSSELDLAKLYLPDYLATFSAFDESLDLSAILRLLGYSKPAPIFQSPDPTLLIQTAADAVRDDVRNKWAHPNLNDWTEAFFNDCFTNLENLLKSVGRGSKETLDQLLKWQTRGCQMVMGHDVDHQLWSLVKQTLALFVKELEAIQDQQLALDETVENQGQRINEMDARLSKLAENHNRAKEMLENLNAQLRPASPPRRPFNLDQFSIKLKDRYKRSSTVQTSVWSAKSKANIRQVYTRLSMVKESRTVSVEYTELFKKMMNGLVPKRMLVVGQAGIGKSTFLTKLCLDWVECEETSDCEDRTILEKFKLVLLLKLREVSHCKTLKEVISLSDLLSDEDKYLTDELLHYINENQEQVLFVFDGYDEYGEGKNSEVFDIFRGDKLRGCSVLVTSRSSQGDDLREFADMYAEVTGFSRKDIEEFVVKQLGEFEGKALMHHLEKERLIDTAKVPILCLFFTMLWKKMREKFTTKNRTMVFLEIVQCILDYDYGKGASDQPRTFEDSKDILADLGEVALEALLSDDLLFEYSKLRQIKGCDVVIRGFLQVTEDTENIRPSERVSFIHKTIQEFLAAWFVVHKLVPERNLGRLREKTRDSESCLRLENVFLFISGLSCDGAGAELVLGHLTDVNRDDRNLQFKQTVVLPGKSEKTCYDLTYRQLRFHDLVFALFDEAQLKEGLLRHCLSSTDGVMILSQRLVKNLLECSDNIFQMDNATVMVKKVKDDLPFFLEENLRKFFDSFDVAVKVTESSQALQLGDFYRKFLNCGFRCMCNFSAVLFSNKGSIACYITDLLVACELHELMFTGYATEGHCFLEFVAEDVKHINQDHELQKGLRLQHSVPLEFPFQGPSEARSLLNAQNPSSDEYLLNHLQSLECVFTSSRKILRAFGVIAGKSKYFNSVKLRLGKGGDFCDFLEPAKTLKDCSIQLSGDLSHPCMSAGETRLSNLLPNFKKLSVLHLNLKDCTKVLVNQLVAVITQSTIKSLELEEVDLIEDTAIVLGNSVCRMSALEVLVIMGKLNELGLAGMQALFGGFTQEIPLRELKLSYFNVRKDGLKFLRNSFQFFPRLEELRLVKLGIDDKDVCDLLRNVNFPELHKLDLSQNRLGHGITSIVSHIVRFPKIFQLVLEDVNCSEEDKLFIIENVKKVRPVFGVLLSSPYTLKAFLSAEQEARSDNH